MILLFEYMACLSMTVSTDSLFLRVKKALGEDFVVEMKCRSDFDAHILRAAVAKMVLQRYGHVDGGVVHPDREASTTRA